MASITLRHGYFGQSRLKYYCPLQRYDQKSHLPNISKRGVRTSNKSLTIIPLIIYIMFYQCYKQMLSYRGGNTLLQETANVQSLYHLQVHVHLLPYAYAHHLNSYIELTMWTFLGCKLITGLLYLGGGRCNSQFDQVYISGKTPKVLLISHI